MSLPRDLLITARQLYANGHRSEARQLIHQSLQIDPNNVQGWLGLAFAADSIEEKRQALAQVVRLDPTHDRAIAALVQLNRQHPPQQAVLPANTSFVTASSPQAQHRDAIEFAEVPLYLPLPQHRTKQAPHANRSTRRRFRVGIASLVVVGIVFVVGAVLVGGRPDRVVNPAPGTIAFDPNPHESVNTPIVEYVTAIVTAVPSQIPTVMSQPLATPIESQPLTAHYTSPDNELIIKDIEGWFVNEAGCGGQEHCLVLANSQRATQWMSGSLNHGEIQIKLLWGPVARIGQLLGISDTIKLGITTGDLLYMLLTAPQSAVIPGVSMRNDMSLLEGYDWYSVDVEYVSGTTNAAGFVFPSDRGGDYFVVLQTVTNSGDYDAVESTVSSLVNSITYDFSQRPVPPLTQRYISLNGRLSFSYPDNWVIEESALDNANGDRPVLVTQLVNHRRALTSDVRSHLPGDVNIMFFAGTEVSKILQVDEPGLTPVDLLLLFLASDEVDSWITDSTLVIGPERLIIGNKPAAKLVIYDDQEAYGDISSTNSSKQMLVLIDAGDGQFILIVTGTYSDRAFWEPIIMAVVETVTYMPVGVKN